MKDLLGPRFGAFAIDYVLLFAVTIVFARSVGELMPDGSYQVTGMPALFVPGFWMVWLVVPEAIWGATLGKMIVGLRVKKLDGDKETVARLL